MNRPFLLILAFAIAFVMSAEAAAQTPVEIDFGVRVGVPLMESFETRDSRRDTVFISSSHTIEHSSHTLGPAVGVLLLNRVELRFEAVRRPVEFHSTYRAFFGTSGSSSVSTTRGSAWEYPILATYRFGSAKTRPFLGGGFSFGGRTTGTTEAQDTDLISGVVSNSTSSYVLDDPGAFYVTGGIEHRTSLVSVRPEVRFTLRSRSETTALIYSPNQLEVFVGIAFHPFRFK